MPGPETGPGGGAAQPAAPAGGIGPPGAVAAPGNGAREAARAPGTRDPAPPGTPPAGEPGTPPAARPGKGAPGGAATAGNGPLSFFRDEPIEPSLLPLSLPAPAGPLPGADSLPGPPDAEVTGILGIDQRTAPGPSPGEVLSRIAADPRITWWVTRALISVVAGVAVTLAAGWRLGITAAAVVAIADTVFRARTSAMIPAPARVTSAQRRTRRRLRRLTPSGYLALHNRQIPGSDEVIDHLVAGPAGVFAIGSQRWDRRLPVRATHGGRLFHGPYPQAGRLRTACRAAEQASQLISAALGEPVAVRPAMVIYGPPVPWIVVKIAGVDVFSGRRLRRYLRRETAASRGRRLDDRQIEVIASAAAQVLPAAR
ncbi:MAG: NERD domain-containing protein [Gemmatimonadota bacterium]